MQTEKNSNKSAAREAGQDWKIEQLHRTIQELIEALRGAMFYVPIGTNARDRANAALEHAGA